MANTLSLHDALPISLVWGEFRKNFKVIQNDSTSDYGLARGELISQGSEQVYVFSDFDTVGMLHFGVN
jgi:hypothetical protein